MLKQRSGSPGLRGRLPSFQRPAGQPDAKRAAVTTYYLILVPALLLGVFGVLMNFSASTVSQIAQGANPYALLLRSGVITVIALFLGVAAAFISPNWWKMLAPTLFLVAMVLQLLLIPYGLSEGGNTNWLLIPGTGFTFQPSELLKLATALLLARSLSSVMMRVDDLKQVLLGAVVPALLAMGAVMIGSDMGTMLIFLPLAGAALWVAGVPKRLLLGLTVAGATAMVFFVAQSASRTRRVIEFLPGYGVEPSTSSPTQTDHGMWALGSGGLTGLGPGASRSKWNYLQEAHTDFILAIVGEEFGLVGTVTTLLLIAIMVYGMLRLSAQGSTAFIRIASAAIASWFIFQTFLNVGTVTGLTPVIGVPFPLVSSGGSSFAITAMTVGVLLSFARSDAGLQLRGRLDPDTAGRDPRKPSKRRRV